MKQKYVYKIDASHPTVFEVSVRVVAADITEALTLAETIQRRVPLSAAKRTVCPFVDPYIISVKREDAVMVHRG